MMWSSNSIPTVAPAALSWAVMVMSLEDGSSPPLGWLWATMTAEARSATASAKTSRGCTGVVALEPFLDQLAVPEFVDGVLVNLRVGFGMREIREGVERLVVRAA